MIDIPHDSASPAQQPDRPKAVRVVSALTIVADVVWLCTIPWAMNRNREAFADGPLAVVFEERFLTLALASCRALPALSQMIGAILLLKLRPAGRSIVLVHYWLFLVVSMFVDFGMLRQCLRFQQFDSWTALQLFFTLVIIVMLVCLHANPFGQLLPKPLASDRRWFWIALLAGPGVSSVLVVVVFGTAISRSFAHQEPGTLLHRLGGWRLVYKIDRPASTQSFRMNDLVLRIHERLDSADSHGVLVNALTDDRVEIMIPRNYPGGVGAVERLMAQEGRLEFRILANQRYDADAIERATQMFRNKQAETAPTDYEWVELADPESFSPEGSHLDETNVVEDGFVLTRVPDESVRVTGEHFARFEPTQDARFRPAIAFHLNPVGTRIFARLTRKYQPDTDGFRHRLAIVLDQQVLSAPAINSPIDGGSGIIEGGQDGFTRQEVDDLVVLLSAGELPARLMPDANEQIPPGR